MTAQRAVGRQAGPLLVGANDRPGVDILMTGQTISHGHSYTFSIRLVWRGGMMSRKTDTSADRTARAVVQRLESLGRAGVTHLGKPPRIEPASAAQPVVESQPRDESPPVADAGSKRPAESDPADRQAALEVIRRKVAACTRCEELARTRTQTVFGVGNPHARLVFLGEAPGADEDRQGIPFVGRAGKLLTDMIEKGMKISRKEVYIMNILRCRPPGNRNPLPIEAAACREYLDGQLEIIRPEIICCLGAVAAQNLLDTAEPIGRMRGRILDYRGIKVICTYHPAYLLRNPAAKADTWEDIKRVMAELGMEVPKK
jgi:DNA polymerase